MSNHWGHQEEQDIFIVDQWLAITEETGCTVSALNVSEAGKKMWQEEDVAGNGNVVGCWQHDGGKS